MKSVYLLPALLSLSAMPAQAALSGFYNSGEQIRLIIESSAIADALRQAPIRSITNTGTRKDGANEWTIQVQECDLIVYLKPQPPKGIGKTTYKIHMPNKCQ